MITAAEIVGAVHTGRPLVRVRHSHIGEYYGGHLTTQGVTQPLDMDVEGLETGRSLLLVRTHYGEPEWRLYVRRADTDPGVLPGTYSWAPETGRVGKRACGARCRNSLGPSCTCRCGGHNHGRDLWEVSA